jgi:hypothetical protein
MYHDLFKQFLLLYDGYKLYYNAFKTGIALCLKYPAIQLSKHMRQTRFMQKDCWVNMLKRARPYVDKGVHYQLAYLMYKSVNYKIYN